MLCNLLRKVNGLINLTASTLDHFVVCLEFYVEGRVCFLFSLVIFVSLMNSISKHHYVALWNLMYNNKFVTFCLKIFDALPVSTGSDKDVIVTVLGARSNKQRQEIAAKYQQKYSKVRLISQSA